MSHSRLADSRLKSLICMRSSSNIYNLSLMSALIEMRGTGAAQQWAQQVVNNFARKPQGNDTSNLAAVASGECGVTIANTYYLGRWLAAGDDSVMNSLTLVFPNQQSSGTHVNISGAGVTKHAPNKANAIRFLEYLTSEYAQTLFAEGNNEYPVVGVTSGPIAALGSFKEDKMDASLLGENQAEAVRVFDRAGWQ
ncbi:MAG: extracellular solute-binding protein [Pseudomonadota bacterium]